MYGVLCFCVLVMLAVVCRCVSMGERRWPGTYISVSMRADTYISVIPENVGHPP